MEVLLVIALAVLGFASRLAPAPPDVADCRLSHSFVLGESREHPGAIEIWACQRDTVVTLTEFQGPWNERQRKFRNALTVEVPENERVVGCKNEDWFYTGVVGATAEVKRAKPALVRAWKANLENWKFEEAEPRAVVCNRDFGLD
jgi:hypothetical protein